MLFRTENKVSFSVTGVITIVDTVAVRPTFSFQHEATKHQPTWAVVPA